jgi:hypothetical protein
MRGFLATKTAALDAAVIPRFDHLARSASHLLRALENFKAPDIEFLSLAEQVESGDKPIGTQNLIRPSKQRRSRDGQGTAEAGSRREGTKTDRSAPVLRLLYRKKPDLLFLVVPLLVPGLVSFLVVVFLELPLPGVVLVVRFIILAVTHTHLVVFVF